MINLEYNKHILLMSANTIFIHIVMVHTYHIYTFQFHTSVYGIDYIQWKMQSFMVYQMKTNLYT